MVFKYDFYFITVYVFCLFTFEKKIRKLVNDLKKIKLIKKCKNKENMFY